MKKNKRISLLLLSVFMLTIVSCAGIQVNTAVADTGLNDVQNHWAAAAITEMVDAGVVSGFPDGTFRPDNNVSRAEFAVLVVKTFKFDMTGGKVFTDTRNHWAKDYVAAANANGVVKGYSDIKFGPDDPITREQMAVMVVAAANLESTSKATSFNDSSSISSWAKEAVAIASEQKIITGFPDGSFQPQATATRAQAVTVLKKAYPDLAPVVDLSKFDKAGTYGPATGTQTIKGDVIISVAGVELQNVTITGDLLISEAVGDGDVTLNNVTVKGVTTIKGGGPDSVYFTDSTFEKVTINKAKGVVRLVLENSKIAELVDNSCVNVVGDGEITKAVFNANDFKSEIIPVKYTIASGKSGIIGGETVKGRTPSGGGPSIPTLTVTAKPAAGDITAGSNVELVASDADADIYYTVDGTTPTESSTKYTAAISVNAEMTIKAIAVMEGYKTSAVTSFEYTIIQIPGVWPEEVADVVANDFGGQTYVTVTIKAAAVANVTGVKINGQDAVQQADKAKWKKTLTGEIALEDITIAVKTSGDIPQLTWPEEVADVVANDFGGQTYVTVTIKAAAIANLTGVKVNGQDAVQQADKAKWKKTLIGEIALEDITIAVKTSGDIPQPTWPEEVANVVANDFGNQTYVTVTIKATAVANVTGVKVNGQDAIQQTDNSKWKKTLAGNVELNDITINIDVSSSGSPDPGPTELIIKDACTAGYVSMFKETRVIVETVAGVTSVTANGVPMTISEGKWKVDFVGEILIIEIIATDGTNTDTYTINL